MTTNRFGNIVFAPPKLPSRISRPVEGLHLVKTIIEYFNRSPPHLNNDQLDALDILCTFRDDHWDEILTPHPNPPYGHSWLCAPTMIHLWQSINTLFFGGPIPHAKFRWQEMKDTYGRAYHSGPLAPTIVINHRLPPDNFGQYSILAFLSVLIHESIHVFLEYHACQRCRSWRKDSKGEHGRHFQTIAQKMEEVFPKLVGLPIDLGRLEGFLGDLGVGRGVVRKALVPSVHDLEVWRFEDVKFLTNDEVRALVERIYAERYVNPI